MAKIVLSSVAISALLAAGVLVGAAQAQNTSGRAGANAGAGMPGASVDTNSSATAAAGGSSGGGHNNERAKSTPGAGTHSADTASTGTHSGAKANVGAAQGHSDPSRTKADLNGKVRGSGSLN